MTIASIRLTSVALALMALFATLAPEKTEAQSYDRRMVIINDTGRTILEFYATNTGVTNWGRDLLGQGVVQPGGRHMFDFNDGTGYCMFDFRAVLDNGRPIERYRVNVCQDSTWVVR